MGFFDANGRFGSAKRFLPTTPQRIEVGSQQGRGSCALAMLPVPSADLARDLSYPSGAPRSFDRIAVELDLLSPGEARALCERAAAGHHRIDDVATECGALTREQVQQVIEEQAFVVHVNAASAGKASFLTWLGALHRQGIFPKVVRLSAHDLDKLKQGGVADGPAEDVDLTTLCQAREILLDAAALNASDVHLLIRERTAEVQIRVKGDLKTAKGISLHADQAERLARAMYTGLATVKEATYNPLSFQDAQIAGYVLPRSGLTSVRIIRGPSWPAESGGGFLVARLQYEGTRREIDPCVARAAAKRLKLATPERPSGEFHLGRMGFTPLQVALIERIMRNPQGIFFVTGPTGSGKTTTLYEIMMELARQYPEQRLITIENPVEYPIQGSLQLSTESERFGEMLRMALRMDPDTILPSEIRGVEEAIAAFQAAQTGHRVPTTLHVNDPYEVFARLAGLDHVRLAPAMIAHHRLIIGLMAQRRVPILCPHCSVPLAQSGRRLPAYLLSALRTWGDLATVRARGDGCEHCDGSNIAHEQAIAEVVVTDEVLMHAVREGDVLRAARKHRAKPGADKPMIEHAIDLVFAGRLDPDDAEQKVEPIPVKELQ